MAQLTVNATQRGYYGLKIRAEGVQFVLKSEADFSPKWMAPVGWKPKAPVPAQPAAKAKAPADKTPRTLKAAQDSTPGIMPVGTGVDPDAPPPDGPPADDTDGGPGRALDENVI